MQLVLKNTALSSSTTPPIHVRVGSDTSEKMSSNKHNHTKKQTQRPRS